MNMSFDDFNKFIGCDDIFLIGFFFEGRDDEYSDFINQGDLVVKVRKSNDVVAIKFLGVRNLVLNTGPYDEISLVGLMVEDMVDSQWPGVKVRVVSDDVKTFISFYCASFCFLD